MFKSINLTIGKMLLHILKKKKKKIYRNFIWSGVNSCIKLVKLTYTHAIYSIPKFLMVRHVLEI